MVDLLKFAYNKGIEDVIEKLENDMENEEKQGQDSPDHYNNDTKCLEAIDEATKDLSGEKAFATASAIKYLWRWDKKNGIEDLDKAMWYITRLIEKEKGT
ncbi:DUF3310 domain-containing protein [Salicibibacter halophilus]|uniref:DUF3310 domain-containing protein n=1 Tax=Salicibibacter halophilus TaxID=2502791 RepID=A0A514LEF6_9BACI|nr:DUF3310 domain-containing protein [Salicibibacter halophilus]QDI90236.1 DUF3310 domain-containing protein [Salicibibacter halophilus]